MNLFENGETRGRHLELEFKYLMFKQNQRSTSLQNWRKPLNQD